ncbi:MAG: RES family NAD+ phosphorylase [Maritimibacter sp.]
MLLPILTPAALSFEAAPWKGQGWQVVEAQHRVSTLKLVDDFAEQRLLDEILDEDKPRIPEECDLLDVDLSAPFRCALAGGYESRFRQSGGVDGVFYASESIETAVAEMVFLRLQFFAESPETPWPDDAADYTALQVGLEHDRAIDLTKGSFAAEESLWRHPTDHAACHLLGNNAREAGIGLIQYPSEVDPAGGTNLALLSCTGFASPEPLLRESWRIRLGRLGAQAICDLPQLRLGISFPRSDYAGFARLAGMVWDRPTTTGH